MALYSQQKLVDSMIVADAIWLARTSYWVAVVSDDEDIIPGLLLAAKSQATIAWMARSSEPREPYRQLISAGGIETIQC